MYPKCFFPKKASGVNDIEKDQDWKTSCSLDPSKNLMNQVIDLDKVIERGFYLE